MSCLFNILTFFILIPHNDKENLYLIINWVLPFNLDYFRNWGLILFIFHRDFLNLLNLFLISSILNFINLFYLLDIYHLIVFNLLNCIILRQHIWSNQLYNLTHFFNMTLQNNISNLRLNNRIFNDFDQLLIISVVHFVSGFFTNSLVVCYLFSWTRNECLFILVFIICLNWCLLVVVI